MILAKNLSLEEVRGADFLMRRGVLTCSTKDEPGSTEKKTDSGESMTSHVWVD